MTKNSNQENTNISGQDAASNRLAAVRDLIFGENMQQYEVNFDEVYDKIAKLQQETESKFADLADELDKKVTSLQNASNASVEKLKEELANKIARLDEAKADRKKLGKALEKIAQMLQA